MHPHHGLWSPPRKPKPLISELLGFCSVLLLLSPSYSQPVAPLHPPAKYWMLLLSLGRASPPAAVWTHMDKGRGSLAKPLHGY